MDKPGKQPSNKTFKVHLKQTFESLSLSCWDIFPTETHKKKQRSKPPHELKEGETGFIFKNTEKCFVFVIFLAYIVQ